jgi:hypothetical protein
VPQVHTGYPSGSLRDGPWGVARSSSSGSGWEEQIHCPLSTSLHTFPDLDGRNKSIAHRPRHYIRRADRLRYADRQVAPSGAIDPLRTSPEIIPGLLACMSCMLELPPQVGVLGGILPSAPAAPPSGSGIPLGTSAPGS